MLKIGMGFNVGEAGPVLAGYNCLYINHNIFLFFVRMIWISFLDDFYNAANMFVASGMVKKR